MLRLFLLSILFQAGIVSINMDISEGPEVILQIAELEVAKGSLRVAVFDSEENFLNAEQAVYKKAFKVTSNERTEIKLKGLKTGYYAIAIFHDINDNEELDCNFFGIPREPYAFSNDAGGKWKKPSFSNARVFVKEDGVAVPLKLQRWKDL